MNLDGQTYLIGMLNQFKYIQFHPIASSQRQAAHGAYTVLSLL